MLSKTSGRTGLRSEKSDGSQGGRLACYFGKYMNFISPKETETVTGMPESIMSSEED